MAHFHIPKPLHGWREFIGEVGIIVLGVLIALAFEQLVETIHWRRNVKDATESLNSELAEAKLNSILLVAARDCIQRRLDSLDTIVDHGDVPRDENVELFGLRTWATDAWEAATTSGAVAHMNSETRDRYASLYGSARLLGELHAKAYDASSRLSTLERHKSLTDVSRDRLETDLAELRALNLVLSVGAQQFIEESEPLHLKLNPKETAALAQKARQFRECASRMPG